ncbi:MAG: ASKHA domain-containing protein [Firmicutes bacterium]|nr:ASKHA domain-containing protein [Bacillota bacterium]
MEITILPNNIKCQVAEGTSLLQVLFEAGIHIDGSCAGAGVCGCCKIQVVSGKTPPADEAEKELIPQEELDQGYRLACRVHVIDNMRILVPKMKNADARKTKLLYFPDDFVPEKTAEQCYGLAFDIGTTTVVCMLWDMKEAELIDIAAQTNPQSVFGADVITRINYCEEKPGNLQVMHDKIIGCLNELADTLIERHSIQRDLIRKATVVGNTTMSHLFLGLSPSTLARIPFTPAFTGPKELKATEIGIRIHPEGDVYLLPNIAGHVGSDLVAGILTSRLMEKSGVHILIDLGTNGEVILQADGHTWACSTAAGPAFEGASIHHGMRAAAGAIESVKVIEGKLLVHTVDDAPARGICGSGLIDATAALITAGVILPSGKMISQKAAQQELPPDLAWRLHKTEDNITEFVLAQGDDGREIVLNHKDVRQMQLGKGAIYSGILLMLQAAGKTVADIDTVLLAGAFGNFINKESAVVLGLLPNIPLDHIIPLGNAAGAGSSIALLSSKERQYIYNKLAEIEHVELADCPNFQEEFIGAMSFPRIKAE